MPVLPTPFLPSGAIDPEAMRAAVRFAIEAGVDGIVFPGFASEVETLTPGERTALLHVVAEEAAGRVRLIAGASAERLDETVRHGRQALDLGITALMMQPPKSIGADADAVASFMGEAARLLPGAEIILQNAPAPRGSDLSPQTVLEVVRRVSAIRYVKEETLPAGPAITALLSTGVPHLAGVIGGGGARYILDEYARGACGAMPALEIADLHVALDRHYRAGELALARRVYVRTLPLLVLQAIYRMRLTKHVLCRRGVLQNAMVRAQTPEFDGPAIADIERSLAETGIALAAADAMLAAGGAQ